jgi:pyruvate kinase
VRMTFYSKISMIIVFSDDDRVAKLISKYRPNCPIIFPTSNYQHSQYLRLIRGVFVIYLPGANTHDEIINIISQQYKGQKILVMNLGQKGGAKNCYYLKSFDK